MSTDLAKLGALQTEWATQQWLRGTQVWSDLFCVWFDAQSALWRDAERGLRAGLPPWLADVRRPLPLQPLLDPPDSLAPAVLQRAMAAWLALGQVCANTLEHDLDQTGQADQADRAGQRAPRAGERRTRARRAAMPRASTAR